AAAASCCAAAKRAPLPKVIAASTLTCKHAFMPSTRPRSSWLANTGASAGPSAWRQRESRPVSPLSLALSAGDAVVIQVLRPAGLAGSGPGGGAGTGGAAAGAPGAGAGAAPPPALGGVDGAGAPPAGPARKILGPMPLSLALICAGFSPTVA